jgi:hypothetical protein
MNNEISQQADLERYRTINLGLAANPDTGIKFIKKLLEEEKAKLEEETTDVWITPEDADEIAKLFR